MNKDSYNSIVKISEGIFKEKGSKFLSFAYSIKSENQAKEYLTAIKKQYHDARHHCYAYKIGLTEDRYRMNDDGEPSGTAGKPIYGQIIAHNLSDVLIVVVRYFGGTLLGTSGLIGAYKAAAISCIENSKIIQVVVQQPLVLKYSYELMSIVMKIAKDEKLNIVKQDFTDMCLLTLNVRLTEYERIFLKYREIYGVTIEI